LSAKVIDDLSDDALDDELLALLLAQSADGGAAPELVYAPGDEPAPLSPAQRSMWFQRKFDGRNTALYNIALASKLTGALDVGALAIALRRVVHRHEALRMRFRVAPGEEVAQQWLDQGDEVPVTRSELPPGLRHGDRPGAETTERASVQAWAERWVQLQAARPFDLEQGPLLRAALLQLSAEEHLLVLVMHHIVSDGWSIAVMMRELAVFYAAQVGATQPSALPNLLIQYADYARWQQRLRESGAFNESLAFWTRQMQDAPPLLGLPSDRPRPAHQSYRGASLRFDIAPARLAELRALGASCRASLFMTLAAAFNVLLARYSGQYDICLGTPTANRPRPELEPLVGFFVNTLVLRTRLDPEEPFEALLQRVRDGAVDAFAHQDLPFDELVKALRPPRQLSHGPLFQVMLALQNAPSAPLSLPGLQVDPVAVPGNVARFDLTLTLTEVDAGLAAEFEYAVDLFDDSTIRRMAGHFLRLLQAVVDDPACRVGDLPLMTDDERQRVLVDWNRTGRAFPGAGRRIHEWVEDWAARMPDRAALAFDDHVWSYAELNRRANRLAHALRDLGIGPEARVALCMERSADLVVSVLAVLKAGGAYVPLDPAQPPTRQAHILADAQPALILTERARSFEEVFRGHAVLSVDAPEDWQPGSADNPLPVGGLDDLAYVIYTSGSTGRPKGVMVTHRGIPNLALTQAEAFRVEEGARVLQFASPAFDASASEFFMCWVGGATLCLSSREGLQPGRELRETLRRQAITVVTLPPVAVMQGGLVPEDVPALRTLVVAGEPCPSALARRWAGHVHLVNAYGPTETTVCATLHACERSGVSDGEPPIGRPIANFQARLLDPRGQPVPIGVPGELHISGPGLARGYLGQPALTAERFIDHPLAPSGGRLYRTGDLARYREDGCIEYLGRLDGQVKLRGLRIELGEVQAALAMQPGVREAHVLLREDRPGDRRLVAYVAPREDAVLVPATLRAALRRSLPDYMVPTHIVAIPALPLSTNGKVDRDALPAPSTRRDTVDFVEPVSPTEQVLAALWADVLGLDRVGRLDDFFALGGHSMLAVAVASRASDAMGRDVPIAAIFAHPVLAELAAELDAPSPSDLLVPLRKVAAAGEAPVVCVHPIGGQIARYRPLAGSLPPTVRVFGLQSHEAAGRAGALMTVEAVAEAYAEAIALTLPAGGVRLVGWSSGGLLALAIAQALATRGQPPVAVALIDTFLVPPTSPPEARRQAAAIALTSWLGGADTLDPSALEGALGSIVQAHDASALVDLAASLGMSLDAGTARALWAEIRAAERHLLFLAGYRPTPSPVCVHTFVPSDPGTPDQPAEAAGPRERPAVGHLYRVPGDHFSLLQAPNVTHLAAAMSDFLSFE